MERDHFTENSKNFIYFFINSVYLKVSNPTQTEIFTLNLTANLTLTETLTQTQILDLKKPIKNAWLNISHLRFILLKLFGEIVYT